MTGKIESLNTAKVKAKAEIEAMLDVYFNRYETAVENKKLTINMIEDFITEAKTEAEKIIKTAANEAIALSESSLVEKKKYAPNVAQS